MVDYEPSYPEMGDENSEVINSRPESGPNPPFSVFTKWQKLWISLATAFAAMFSTMSSYLYLPALLPISKELNVSILLINLTVTSYLVVAGVAPAFMGDMADQNGRRPVYILMFLLMIGANVGIAIQESYPALLVFRMIQSAGSSGLYGAAYGVIADIATINERGSYVGVLLMLTDSAPSSGPVIAGALIETVGWRWIFWLLVIITGSHFLLILLFLPETQRNLVGNGERRPQGVYWSCFTLVQTRRKEERCAKMSKRSRRFPNPLACLPILRDRASLLVILVTSVNYAVKMALQTSLSSQAVKIYHLDYLDSGLIFLPSGIGGGIGSFITGKILDKIYQKTVERLQTSGHPDVYRSSPDFPLERTRLKGIYVLSTISAIGTVGYGLALMTKTHISVMLVMQFLTGTTTTSTHALCGTLLTDLNTHKSATAQAACNLVRCLGAGVLIAILEVLLDAIGLGWTFAIYGAIIAAGMPLAWVLQRYGVTWRQRKATE